MPKRMWALAFLLAGLLGGISGCGTSAAPPADSCLGESAGYPAGQASGGIPRTIGRNKYQAAGNPFEPGALSVRSMLVTPCGAGCPLPLEIHVPQEGWAYPIIQFQHGFMMDAHHYTEVLQHLASQGFVVVAPQMYPPGGVPVGQPLIREEATALLAVMDWVAAHAEEVTGVAVDSSAIGLVGHSRGGKVAWLAASWAAERIRAIAGVDPMDGTAGGWSRVINGPFSFALPSLIIGAGLGSLPAAFPGVVCAPEGQNHEQFYAASPSPSWHVIAPQAGHADILDDHLPGCGPSCFYCPAGPDRAGVRRLAAGLLAAFFRGTLQGDVAALDYLADPQTAPIPVEVESR